MEEFQWVDVLGSRRGVDRVPNECPLCHFTIHPTQATWSLINERTSKAHLEIVYQCPRHECGRLFIAQHCLDRDAGTTAELSRPKDFILYNVHPVRSKRPDVPFQVTAVSPDFEIIYSQALTANALGLTQIAGGGLRKALEFLIKDYCSDREPAKLEVIRESSLGACIQGHVGDANIKACAKRAAWLGNDEIHYLRKWTDKDIQDLNILVQLTIGWIQNELLTKSYIEAMPEK